MSWGVGQHSKVALLIKKTSEKEQSSTMEFDLDPERVNLFAEEHAHPFARLTPDQIVIALLQHGFEADGRIMALNSYENRVFQVGLDQGGFLIAKFYRPGRWSDEAILEEHAYLNALAEAEVPVSGVIANHEGQTLFKADGYRFSLSPRMGGRVPEIEDLDTLEALGRLIARMHAIGKKTPFVHRPEVSPLTYGHLPAERILASGLIPSNRVKAYESALRSALMLVDEAFSRAQPLERLRLHADLYAGNILDTGEGPLLLDFDDARMGPRVQDLWMLAQGSDQERQIALMTLIEGYDTFEAFDLKELRLIEPLRTLRLIHFTEWLSARTQDPAFFSVFPHFGSDHDWIERTVELQEQIERMQIEGLGLF